jgi:hypothetical protein
MNLKDRITELALMWFDGLMDLVTLGKWSRWQGSRVVSFKVLDDE